ncbi:hypothetical protein BJX99DRAFT_120473 [Aspergillus californicus]
MLERLSKFLLRPRVTTYLRTCLSACFSPWSKPLEVPAQVLLKDLLKDFFSICRPATPTVFAGPLFRLSQNQRSLRSEMVGPVVVMSIIMASKKRWRRRMPPSEISCLPCFLSCLSANAARKRCRVVKGCPLRMRIGFTTSVQALSRIVPDNRTVAVLTSPRMALYNDPPFLMTGFVGNQALDGFPRGPRTS